MLGGVGVGDLGFESLETLAQFGLARGGLGVKFENRVYRLSLWTLIDKKSQAEEDRGN